MNKCIYPEKLLEEIKKKKKYIPRRIRNEERLKLFKKYWISEYGIIKVKDIYIIHNIDHYFITYNNGNMYGVIPYPIKDECYELLRNFNELENENFINKKKLIYGAEIKFWFVINEINFNNDNYSGFLDKLSSLQDSKKYTVHRNKKRKEYDFIPEN